MKKIPFNLESWLSDKSQKVITRDGRPVEILKTNMPGELPLLVLYDGNDVERVSTDGKYQIDYDGMNDLFLVTEDEPLTEFEKTVSDLCWRVGMGEAVKDASQIKREADKLLSIARKQIESEALKDLPKWKRADKREHLEEMCVILYKSTDLLCSNYVEKGEYYIPFSELEKLQKEE